MAHGFPSCAAHSEVIGGQLLQERLPFRYRSPFRSMPLAARRWNPSVKFGMLMPIRTRHDDPIGIVLYSTNTSPSGPPRRVRASCPAAYPNREQRE